MRDASTQSELARACGSAYPAYIIDAKLFISIDPLAGQSDATSTMTLVAADCHQANNLVLGQKGPIMSSVIHQVARLEENGEVTKTGTSGKMPNQMLQYPRPGMLATIRNRRGIISSVDGFSSDSTSGQLHLVTIEYTDADGMPEDTVLWEREHGRDLLEPNALPRVEADPAMEPREFDAIVRAARWSALSPFLHPDGSGRSPEMSVSAPFFGAVQVDDFQLVPLLKALQMPRVSLLIADDV